jgi:hypothetical protein
MLTRNIPTLDHDGDALAKYLRVTWDGDALNAAGATAIGVGTLADTVLADDDKAAVIPWHVGGCRKMVAAGAFSKGDAVYGAAGGKIDDDSGSGANVPIGYAMEDASGDDSIVEVLTFTTPNANYDYPAVDGTAGQVLNTDGSGTLSWTSAPTLTGLTMAAATITAATIAQLTYKTASRTATDTGATTGTIADSGMLQFITPDWDSDADHILVLPTPTPGTIVIIAGAATGGELRSSAPATVAINGGTGASAESAIGANTMVIAICESATSWKALQIGSDGTLAQVEAAA